MQSMQQTQNYLSQLRRHPLLWNLALIAAIILAMAGTLSKTPNAPSPVICSTT